MIALRRDINYVLPISLPMNCDHSATEFQKQSVFIVQRSTHLHFQLAFVNLSEFAFLPSHCSQCQVHPSHRLIKRIPIAIYISGKVIFAPEPKLSKHPGGKNRMFYSRIECVCPVDDARNICFTQILSSISRRNVTFPLFSLPVFTLNITPPLLHIAT